MARKNRVLIYINCVVLVLHSIMIIAISTVPVYALSASGIHTTIASIIISLMLQTGTAPVNQTYIDALNSSYGVESSIGTIEDMIANGLLTESGTGLVDTGLSTAIESQPAYTELGLSELFTTTSDDVAGGVLAGSGGVNLANTAINCGTAGTIGAFAGAATVGVGIGVLINKVGDYIGKFVKYGLPMSAQTRRSIAENFPDGYDNCFYGCRKTNNNSETYSQYVFTQGDVVGVSYLNPANNSQNAYATIIKGLDTTVKNYEYKQYLNSTLFSGYSGTFTINTPIAPSMSNAPANVFIESNMPMFNNEQEANNYINNVINGTVQKPEIKAPDIIGIHGNQIPDQVINTIPEGYDMIPVDMEDYQDYADIANENTENDNTGTEQGNNLINLIDDLLSEPSLVPDQGVDIPAIPDRPIIPEQPTIPGKDPITQEEQDLINSGLVNTELANVFPFCIPFDIYAMITSLKAGREAPVIVFEFPEEFGWGGITIDLSRWDEAATILRHMELLLFIIGLAVNTRSLIGATG